MRVRQGSGPCIPRLTDGAFWPISVRVPGPRTARNGADVLVSSPMRAATMAFANPQAQLLRVVGAVVLLGVVGAGSAETHSGPHYPTQWALSPTRPAAVRPC